MRFLLLSDVHGKLDILKKIIESIDIEVNYVLFAGDIAPYGGVELTLNYLKKLNEIISSKFKVPILAVPGNMDLAEHYVEANKQGIVVNIHGKGMVLTHGIGIIGIGGSPPTPFGTPTEFSEEYIENTLNQALQQLKDKEISTYVLLAHSPPYNTKCDVIFGGDHVGSKSIRKFIVESKPALCVCGHIHESRAIDTINNTIVVNVGPAMKGFYAIAIYREEGWEVNLEKL